MQKKNSQQASNGKGAANIINVEIKVGTDTKGVGSSELPEVSSL